MTTILHVEDEPDIQEVARIALESVGGLAVTPAASGREALLKLQASSRMSPSSTS